MDLENLVTKVEDYVIKKKMKEKILVAAHSFIKNDASDILISIFQELL